MNSTKSLKVFGHASILISALMVAGFPLNAAAENKEVFLLSWGGTVQASFEKEGWAGRFKKDTGYTLTLIPKATSAEIIAAAIAQKSKPQVDVVMCDLPAWSQGLAQQLFAPLDSKKIPNLAQMVPAAKIGDKGVAPYADVLSIVYNPELFKKNGWAKPTSVADLGRAEFKGRLLFPPVSNTYGMYGLIELARANGGNETNIEPGFVALKKLAPNVVDWTSTHAKMVSMFEQGTAAVALYANGPAQDMRNRGAPVDIIIPKPSYLSSSAAGIMNNAPNPEGAAALVNWLIGKDFLTYRAEKFGNTPLNSTVHLEGNAAKSVVQGEELKSLIQVNYADVLKNRAEWNQRFEREVLTIR
jgi:putative spermidine/putrescine transport system substrate-binding protein